MNAYLDAQCPEGHVFRWLVGTPFVCTICGYKMYRSQNDPLVPLTPREREVVALISMGLSNRQIAEKLVIGEGTVEQHVHSVLRKLGLATRTQIARYGWEHRINFEELPGKW